MLFWRIVLLGLLLIQPALGQAYPTKAPSSPPVKNYTLNLRLGANWIDTGLQLHPGDLVHVVAGTSSCGFGWHRFQDLPLPSAPAGVVLAKLAPEDKPIPVTPDAQFAPVVPRHLYLALNGDTCEVNIPVKVQVQRDK